MHDVKVYKCNFCGDEYKWINSVQQHMKKHEGCDGEIRLRSEAHIQSLVWLGIQKWLKDI